MVYLLQSSYLWNNYKKFPFKMILNIYPRIAIHFLNAKNSYEEQSRIFLSFTWKKGKKMLFLLSGVFRCISLCFLFVCFCPTHVRGNYISLFYQVKKCSRFLLRKPYYPETLSVIRTTISLSQVKNPRYKKEKEHM